MADYRRDCHRRGPQRTDRGRAAAAGRAAHAVPRLQAVRRRDGLDRGAVRRLQVRDRRLGADPDVGDGEPRTRARRSADRRPRRDVGVAARRRRRAAGLLHRPDEADDAHQRGARRGGRQRDGRADGLVPGADAGAGPVRRGPAAEDARRDVRLRDKRIRAVDDHRHAVRVGHRCARPLPAGQGEARRAARHAVAAGGQHHLPRARDARHRRGAGVRVRRPRRERAADQEAARRHRRAHVAPARRVHVERRRAAAAQQGRRDPGRRRPGHRGPPRGRRDDHRADRRLRRRTRPHGQRPGRPRRGARRHPRAVLPHRPPRQLPADALRARRHTGVRGALRVAQRSRRCSRTSASSARRRNCSSSGRTAGAASCPPIPPIALQIPSVNDPGLAPPGKHAASAFSLWFPDRGASRRRATAR